MSSPQDEPNPPPRLQHRPVTLKAANEFVDHLHRQHKPVRGHKSSIAATLGDVLVGVAIVGHPVSRIRDDGLTLELTRLCADGMPQANRVTIHILAAVAEHEREMISQRTKRRWQQQSREGNKLGNPNYLEALAPREWPSDTKGRLPKCLT